MVSQKTKGPSLSEGFLRHLGLNNTDFQGNGRGKARSRRQPGREEKRGQGRDGGQSLNRRVGKPSPKPRLFENAASQTGKLRTKPVEPSSEEETDDSNGSDVFDMSEEEESGESDDDADSKDPASANIPKQIREKLQKDDAEIAELERKLGIRGRKNLPKSFEEDGLGDLMGSLGSGDHEDEELAAKRKRKAEAEEWLRQKRRKAVAASDEDSEDEEDEGWDEGDSADEGSDDLDGSLDSDEDVRVDRSDPTSGHSAPKRQRENPYVAPVVAAAPTGKYVPPALRQKKQTLDADSEVVSRVRRQAHHLIARLSDANMLTILGDVEKLYLDFPRQYVTDAVVDKLLEQTAIEGALSNSVVMLVAGFATAMYQVKGIDFGAHFVQQSATLFRQHYDALAKNAIGEARAQHHSWAPTSKVLLNLLGLMAELYNFRMIGPNLVYDYIRMLLHDFTESNTELLLRVFEASGHRLRQDDPRALKDIVSLIQPAVLRAGGESKLSARTKHMIERIHELKKSDKKKTRDPGGGSFGYAERIRKTLINLANTRKLEATGSLRVGLSDIEQVETRGKWWLVGASWAGLDEVPADGKEENGTGQSVHGNGQQEKKRRKTQSGTGTDDVLGSWGDAIPDVDELEQLAREQGMNTNARRSIFVALLSAADSKDAHERLLRLGLNKYDKREIANVLIRCVGSEQHFNRYYALVARQVCSTDHRMGRVFQISLWKLFRRLGEPMFGELADEDDTMEGDEATDLRRAVNTAKMYGYLIATGCLGLDILKCLQLVNLQAKTQMFVHVLLITLFEEARSGAKGSGSSSNNTIRKRFAAVSNNAELRRGLSYFLQHVVRKSKLVPQGQTTVVAKACEKAQQALSSAAN